MAQKANIARRRIRTALSRASSLAAAAAVAAVSLDPRSAQAATKDWSATATSTAWTTAGNWVGGVAPVSSLTTDIAQFNQATYAFQPSAGTTSITGVIIGSSSGALTLSGTALSIGASGVVMNSGAAGSTISSGVTLGAVQTWTNNSANTLTLSGVVTGAANAWTLGGSGAFTTSAGFTSTVAAGSVALTIGTGAGSNTSVNFTNTAAGTNSVLGDIAINGGKLTYNAGTQTTGNALGVGSGSVYRQIILSNGGIFSVQTADFNDNTPTTTNKGAGFIFNIAATGGTFDVGAGRIFSTDDGTGTGTATTASQLQGTGTITKTGLGIWRQDDSTAFAGAFNIAAGTFQPSTANAGGATTAGTTIQSGAQYDVNGISVTTAEPLILNGTGLASAPAGAISNSNAAAGGHAGPITLASAASIGTAAAGGLTLSGGVTGAFPLTITNQGNGGTTFTTAAVNNGGTITNSGTGGGVTTFSSNIGALVTNITQNAANSALVLSGTNTYTGNTTASQGVLAFTTTAAIPGYATNAATAFARISAASGATVSLPFGGTNSVTTTDLGNFLNGTYGTFASGSSLGLDTTNASPSPAVLGIAITDTTAGSLGFTKTGTNALTVGSANTYTGKTLVANGTLNVSLLGNATSGLASSLGAPTTVANGTINLGFGTTTGIVSYTGAGETTDRVLNLSGTTGGGGIDNSGTGALTFSSAMTFTGTGAKSLLLSGAGNINFSQAIAGGISTGTAPLTINKSGAGTATLSGANTATTLVVSGGILDTGAGGLTLNNVGAATIQATGNATINGAITLGGVTVLQSGATVANGADIGATVAGVTLTINAVISGGDTNGIDFWSQPTGVTVLTGANTFSGQSAIAGQTVSVGQINSVATNAGLGTVHLSASNFGSPTLVPQGTIQFGNGAVVGTLRYTGTGEVTDRVINLQGTTGGGTIEQSGTGLLKFVSANTATGAGAKVLTLQGSTAGTGEIAGAIVDNAAANTTGVTKLGTGTWTLSGVNTYTGPTLASAGNLVLRTGSLANTATTIGSGGTLSVAGNYTIGNTATAAGGGSVTLAAGGILNLQDGAINKLTLSQGNTYTANALNLNGGMLAFDIGATGDQIAVAGASAAAAATGVNTIVINSLSGFGLGSYTLVTANAGTLTNANFALASNVINVGGTPYSLSLSGTATTEVLTVSAFTNSAPGTAYWNGTTNSSWSTQPGGAGTATNWVAAPNGTPDTFSLPGGTTNVYMSSNSVGTGGLTTTIDGIAAINSLTFTGTGTSNTAGSTINAGTGTSLMINAAAVSGNPAGNGITVQAGSGANTINVPVVLGASQTWTNNSTSALTASGVISESAANTGLGIAGTGPVVLSNSSNTYTGATTLNSGTLSIPTLANGGLPSSIGQSSNAATNLVFAGNSTLAYTGSSVTIDRAFTINAGVTATIDVGGSTVLSLPGHTGAVTTGALTKTGTGALTISGATTNTGNITVSNGTLNITGSIAGLPASTTLAYGGSATNTVVNVSGSFNGFIITGANVAGSNAVFNQTAGTVTIVPPNSADQQYLANNGGYGMLNITGGVFNTGRFDGVGATATQTSAAVIYVGGAGTLNQPSGDWFLPIRTAGMMSMTVAPGGSFARSTAVTSQFSIIGLNGTNTYGVLNVAGGTVDTGTKGINFSQTSFSPGTGNVGVVNLSGGTLMLGLNTAVGAAAGATSGYFNFAGGTLKATAGMSAVIPASTANYAFTSTIFGPITNNNSANSTFNSQIGTTSNFTGGLTVDTNNFAVTFSNPLLGAESKFGVTQANIAIPSTGNSGYIGAPMVQFSAPTGGGVPATGYALISGGQVTGIVITNPGTYPTGDTPTITFTGGGGSITPFTTSPITTANAAAGLTKTGLGTLTLSSGASTFTGGVTINQGTLALGATSAIPSANTVTINTGGSLDAATFNNTVANLSLKGGTLTGSTGVITSVADYDLQSGAVNFTGTGGLGGSVNATKTTAGTVTLTNNGLGSFANTINLNGGTLAFSTSAQLGNAAATNTLAFSGGTLSYVGTGPVALGATRTAKLNAGGGTFDVSNSTGALTLTAGIDSTGTGNLTKTGPGQLIIPGATNLNGGAAIVNGGLLQAGFGTGGASGLTVGAAGNLSFQNGAAEVLTLSGTGTVNLSGGAQLGFELGASGTNDQVVYNTATSSGTVTLNFFNLAGFGAGNYTLLTSATTGGFATTSFSLGNAPTGFNYTINNDGTIVSLITSAYSPIYWNAQNASNLWNASGPTNFSTTADGLTDAARTPLATETVIFNAANAVGPSVTSTLDSAYTIDSLQFVDGGTPTVNSVTLAGSAPASTLTLKPASSSGGILVSAAGFTTTISANVILDNTSAASQTWAVTDATSTLAVTGNLTLGANINKTGAGTLTLGGSNTGAGNVTLTAGKLNINSATALGTTGRLTIAAGTTIDNTSGGSITLTNNNPQSWNGDFTFAGSNPLNVGTGAVTLANNPTLTVTANNLTVGGVIGGASQQLTKAGAGALTLNGNNAFSGGLTLSAGTLNLGHAGAVGTGAFTIVGGTFDNTSGAAMTLANNNAINLAGNTTFTGTNNLNTGTGGVALTGTPTVTVTANTLTIGGAITGAGGLTKAGAGTLNLAGASTYVGATTISGGTVNLTGSINNVSLGTVSLSGTATLNLPAGGSITGNPTTTLLTYGTAAGNSVINVTGGAATVFGTQGGNASGAVSVLNLSGGTITVTPGSANNQYVAKAAGGYGYLNITGGTYKISGAGNRFDTNGANNLGTGLFSTGVVFVGGTNAFLDHTNAEWFINGYSRGQVTVAPGGTIDHTGSSSPFAVFMDTTVAGGAQGTLNVAGGTVTVGAQPIRFGNSTTAANGTGNSGFVNLAGGTLSVGSAMTTSLPTTPATTNNIYINFAGGTLKTTANITNWNLATSGTSYNALSNVYGPIDNSAVAGAPSFTGGMTVDTGTFTLQLNNITAATGAGVTQANLSVAAGSGYVGAPAVEFSTTNVVAGGSPASGYAVLNGSGGIAGIVITNPGTYTAGTVPTVTLTGGGGTGAAVTLSALNTLNTSGGFTKIGTGTVVVQGANNFAGPLAINEGTFQVGNSGTNATVPNTSSITVASGATFAISRSNASSQATDFPQPITGAGNFATIGAGTTTLTLANTYAGTTTITTGALQIGAGGTTGTMGANAVTNNGTLIFNRTDTYTLTATNLVTGTGGVTLANSGTVAATVDNQFDVSGTLTLGASNGSTVATTLNLTNGSSSFGGLTVQTDTATANLITLGANKTLSFDGSVSTGTSAGTSGTASIRNTNVTFTGAAGSSVAVNLGASGTFRVGIFSAGTNVTGKSLVDFSGVPTLSVAGGATSSMTVGVQGDNSATGVSSLRLASQSNLIQVPTITIGAGSTGAVHTFLLGNGNGATNVINTNTISIATGSRDSGSITFDTGPGGAATPGLVTIRNFAGSGPVALNMATNAGTTTGYGLTNTLDFTGHVTDAQFGAANIGATTSTRVGSGTNTVSFDKGTVTFASIAASTRTTAGTMDSTFNFGSSASTLSDTFTVTNGFTQLSNAGTIATAIAKGTVNVGGGTVTIGATSGTAINMANSSFAGATATGQLNVTGGKLTLGGNIIRTGGVGTENTTITLEAATATANPTLDMAGFNIGTGTAPVGSGTGALNFRSGTLQNVGTINGTAGITKSASAISNTLTVTGVNGWTGPTTITGGTLALKNSSATATTATLSNTAITVSATPAAQQTLLVSSAGSPTTTVNAGNTITAGAGATLTLSAGTGANPGGNFSMADGLLNTFNLIQEGTFAGPALTIGGPTGTSANAPVLTFDIGSTAGGIDVLNVTKDVNVGSATGGKIAINPIGTSIALGNYTFINAASGLGVSGLSLSTPVVTAGTSNYALFLNNSTSTSEVLTVLKEAPAAYWSGAINASWFTGVAPFTGITNWRTDATNNVDTQGVPTSATNVFFSTATPTAGNLTTTLDSNFTVNSVNVLSANTSAVSITPGAGTPTATLTVNAGAANGNTAGNGINIASGAGALTISTPMVLGAAQTWTNNGTGLLAISGATVAGANTNLTIDGTGGTSISSAIQTGTGGLVKNGTGTATLTGASNFTGSVTVNAGTLVAAQAGGNNTANPTSSSLGNPQVVRNITVNNGGTLKFDTGDTFGGNTTNVAATLVVNAGGTVTTNPWFTTLGAVQLNGGTLTGTGGATNAQFQMYSLQGTVTVGGASASVISGPAAGGSTFGGYHLSTNTTFNVADATASSASDLNVSGSLIDRQGGLGAGGLTKSGAGTMTLSADNGYTGPTSITGGTLVVANVAGSATGTGTVTVGSGATVAGSGSIAGPLTVTGGTVSPGQDSSTAALTVGGAVSLTGNTSVLRIKINGTTAITGYDQLTVSNAADRNVTLTNASLTVNFGTYLSNTGSETFVVVNNTTTAGTVVGAFTNLNVEATPFAGASTNVTLTETSVGSGIFKGTDANGFQYTEYVNVDGTAFNPSSPTAGNDVVLTVVPEPGTVGLAGVAMAGLLLGRRRRAARR